MMNGASMCVDSHARSSERDADDHARARPRRARRAACQSPSSTSASRAAISRASAESGCDADRGRGLADLAQDGVVDGSAAGGLLEGGDVQLGDALEVVLAPAEVERRCAHRAADVRHASRAARARPRASPTSWSSTGIFSATSSGSSENQPTSLTIERLAERERADRRARRLAHRGRAEVDVHVGTRSSAPTGGVSST